jgi:hypothetical protein
MKTIAVFLHQQSAVHRIITYEKKDFAFFPTNAYINSTFAYYIFLKFVDIFNFYFIQFLQQSNSCACVSQQQPQILLCTDSCSTQNYICSSNCNSIQQPIVPQQQFICVSNTPAVINQAPLLCVPQTPIQQTTSFIIQQQPQIAQPIQIIQAPQTQPAQYLKISSACPQVIETIPGPNIQSIQPQIIQDITLSLKFFHTK